MSERAVAATDPLWAVTYVSALVGVHVFSHVMQSVPGVPFDVGTVIIVLVVLVLVAVLASALLDLLE